MKSKTGKYLLYIFLVIFMTFMYSCADRLCSAYTGQAYIGHGPQPKALRR